VTPPATGATRSYDSSRRRESAAGTRADVLAAATQLFVKRGWARTSMREIARQARVSVETVYAAVGSKGEVLRAALDAGVVGDGEPIPLRERPEFLLALSTGTLEHRARAAADLIAVILPRTAPLYRVLQHGAAAEPALAELLETMLANQQITLRAAVAAITGREPTDLEVDGIYALFSNEIYLVLTENCGWDNETFRAWAADTVVRLLAPSHRTRED
jgi:AcrR family transcriptional regulator